MQAMRTFLLSLVVVAAVLPALAGPAQPIYRVDNASATIVDRHLVITANGAVRTGGWNQPQLRIRLPTTPDGRTLEVTFVARPPAPREAVVQALLPVAALKRARLPNYGTMQVKIITETNTLVVPITR